MWARRIGKVVTNFFFTVLQCVLDTWKRMVLYWLLLSPISNLMIPTHLVTQCFSKRLVSWNGWLILSSFVFCNPFIDLAYSFLTAIIQEAKRKPWFNYLVMFSGIVGYFDKNRTFVKLANCEKNCHINHLLFSKHLFWCHVKCANTISAKTEKVK